jgi:protocatechuate 3,4-dioxygenase beta subunit
MKPLTLFSLALGISLCSCSQNKTQTKTQNVPATGETKVGGSCEGCEAVYDSPVPFDQLNEVDTLPGFGEPGPKIEISGKVYKRDGKTPARDVVLYVYHTDQQGLYPKVGPGYVRKSSVPQHGAIRGWIKTDETGAYKFYTLVPASYPNSNNPKHIHPVIKEPGKSAYWIDEFVFDDDPLLPAEERSGTHPVGGSGVLKPVKKEGMLRATRDIILGLNVKDYPAE